MSKASSSIANDTSRPNAKNAHPLPLPSVLRDLAVLRASDIELSSLVLEERAESAPTSGSNPALEDSVIQSMEFINEGRKAVKILDRGDVTVQGEKIERMRQELEEVDHGLVDKV